MEITFVREFQAVTIPQNSTCPISIPERHINDKIGSVRTEIRDFTIDGKGVTLKFRMYQGSVTDSKAPAVNDNFYLSFIKGKDGPALLRIIVDASLNCKTSSTQALLYLRHDQCGVPDKYSWTKDSAFWGGTLTVPVSALDANLSDENVTVRIYRHVQSDREYTITSNVIPIRVFRTTRLRAYVFGGPDFTDYIGSKDPAPHRAVGNFYVPFAKSLALSGTFADDGGAQLAIRSKAIQDLLDKDSAKGFACRSCGSFQTDAAELFGSPITSQALLGLDLSKLGVDIVPFDFKVASYPIDFGYKLFSAATTSYAGFATFGGTSKNNGAARDTVVHLYANREYAQCVLAYAGFYDAVANRSSAPAPSPKPYPSITNLLLHSSNQQITIGFTTPTTQSVKRECSYTTHDSPVISGLLRYGTQGRPDSQALDVAISFRRIPPFDNTWSLTPDSRFVTGAFGFRAVGQSYAPIDGVFDPHVGERGWYGNIAYNQAFGRDRTFQATFSAYRFFDAAQVRDEAAGTEVTYPISPSLSIKATYQIGTIAISQVGRANKIIVSDALGGGTLLPNGGYSLSLTTHPADTLIATIGYTRSKVQNCNTDLATPPPCFAVNSAGFTGGLHFSPFKDSKRSTLKDLFLEVYLANPNSTVFPSARALPIAQSMNDSTAGRIVHKAALGFHLNKCSSLLLTAANNEGGVDALRFPDAPGYSETASLDLAPATDKPSMIVAFSRSSSASAKTAESDIFLRIQLGVPQTTYVDAVNAGCS